MGEVEEGRSSQIPGFNRQLFGPLKDTREMINYVNRAPGGLPYKFVPILYQSSMFKHIKVFYLTQIILKTDFAHMFSH